MDLLTQKELQRENCFLKIPDFLEDAGRDALHSKLLVSVLDV